MCSMYLVVIFIIAVYLYGVKNYGYWKKRGVKHDTPLPYVGTNLKQYLQKASYCMMGTETYRKYPNEKVVGFYRGSQPELVIRDLEIIKRILVTDFQHFHYRGLNPNKKVVEPMMRNIFFEDGDVWKLLRQRITPAFSTGKLKAMFPLITKTAHKLQKLAKEISEQEGVCDARELMARYTTDFIGACGFGIEMDTLNEENSEFRKLGKRIFYRNTRDAICGALKLIFPELCKNMHFLSPEIEQSMVHLVNTVLKERNYKSSGKNDFIDMMIELKEKGNMIGESLEEKNPDGSPKIVQIELDDLLLTAQVFVFFGAGFETSSSTSSFTLHQLAYHPEWQEKVQREIDRVLAKYDNKITYDAVNEMTYLEMAFNEAMRMNPSVGFLMRQCASPEYTIPEVDITINKGVNVLIPVEALHNDEQYFEEPEKFKPERFSKEVKNDIINYTYLPFGEGPRACAGARLGQMQARAGLVAVLSMFSVEPAATSRQVPVPDPTAIVAEGIIGGLPLVLKERKTNVS